MRGMMTAVACAAALVLAGGPVRAQTASGEPVWVAAWTASAAPDRKDGTPEAPVLFNAQTVRQDMRLGTSATALRFRVTNELGAAPLHLDGLTARLTHGQGAAVPVTFDGRNEVVIPVGAAWISDPVALTVPAFGDVSLSVHFPEATQPAVRRTPVRIVEGRGEVPDSTRVVRRQNVVSAVYAQRDGAPTVVVALGDSITEGATATLDAHREWTSLLARRFEATCPGQIVVLNQGISGNRLMDHGRSHSALARLDRDVLALPQVDYVILLEGINDIRHNGDPARPGRNAADMILGYRQVVSRLHDRNIRVMGGTLTPFEGSERYEPVSEGTRQALNRFIREDGVFEGVIDFDAAVRDPAKPEGFREGTSRDDRLHPNDEGYRLMAESIDLAQFGCRPA